MHAISTTKKCDVFFGQTFRVADEVVTEFVSRKLFHRTKSIYIYTRKTLLIQLLFLLLKICITWNTQQIKFSNGYDFIYFVLDHSVFFTFSYLSQIQPDELYS